MNGWEYAAALGIALLASASISHITAPLPSPSRGPALLLAFMVASVAAAIFNPDVLVLGAGAGALWRIGFSLLRRDQSRAAASGKRLKEYLDL